jgi:hypothetical protein
MFADPLAALSAVTGRQRRNDAEEREGEPDRDEDVRPPGEDPRVVAKMEK